MAHPVHMTPPLIKKEIGKISTGREEAPRQREECEQSTAACPVHGVWGTESMLVAGAQGTCVESGWQQDKYLEGQIQTRPRALNARLNVTLSRGHKGSQRGWSWLLGSVQ